MAALMIGQMEQVFPVQEAGAATFDKGVIAA